MGALKASPDNPLPLAGLVTLVCPAGAETAPISHGETGYEAYREAGPGRGRWLVDVPREVARFLCWNGGFAPAGRDPNDALFRSR